MQLRRTNKIREIFQKISGYQIGPPKDLEKSTRLQMTRLRMISFDVKAKLMLPNGKRTSAAQIRVISKSNANLSITNYRELPNFLLKLRALVEPLLFSRPVH